jgi:hypothetical protein
MIVFGGGIPCGPGNNEVWVLTNANGLGGEPNWIELSPTGGPIPISAGAITSYDPVTNRMTAFNVGHGSPGGITTDVWVLEHANGLEGTPNWTQLSTTGGAPTSQSGRGVYDPITNRMIVHGGIILDPLTTSNKVWILDNANGLGATPNWTQLNLDVPGPKRAFHSLILNAETNRMTMFAGYSFYPVLNHNDTWVLPLPIDALIDIDPDTLNTKSHGKWITVYITLREGFDVAAIDTSTIAITSLGGESCDPNYIQAADLDFTPEIGDRDEDGTDDLTVKFDRQILLDYICLDDVSITIEGELTTGEHFSGSDSIRIIDRGK